MSACQRISQKNALFYQRRVIIEIKKEQAIDEVKREKELCIQNMKKSSTGEGAAGGERRIWERMEKKWKDRKIDNSDFIDSVGDNL